MYLPYRYGEDTSSKRYLRSHVLRFVLSRIAPSGSQLSATEVFRNIIRNEGGPRALYRGISANLVGVTPEKAIKLAANDYFRGVLRGNKPKITLVEEMAAGAGAGFCQVIATNPMEITKIKLQLAAQSGKPGNLGAALSELGLKGLYKGTPATLARDIPFSMVFFALSARIKVALQDKQGKVSFGNNVLAGLLAGGFAAALTTPFDVVKTRIQADAKGLKYNGLLDCATKTYAEGLHVLTKGWQQRVLIIGPLFAVTLSVYEVQRGLWVRHLEKKYGKAQ